MLTLLVGVLLGLFCRPKRLPERVVDIQRDTTIVHDTVEIERPVEIERHTKETLYVHVTDTLHVHDTLYVGLVMESKTYKGEDYMARVSGYMPMLDYIEVYPKTVYVREVQTVAAPERPFYVLDFGLNAGRGVTPYIAPNLGLEVGYKRWSVTGEAGLELGIDNRVLQNPVFYYELGFRYALIKR